MSDINNKALENNLQAMIKTLRDLLKATDNHESSLPPALTQTVQQQAKELINGVTELTLEQLTYEFFEQASDLIEYITDLRLVDIKSRQLLAATGTYQQLTGLVKALKKIIYLHPAIAAQYFETHAASGETLDAVQKHAEEAAKYAMEAAKAAEKFNHEGALYLEKIQKQQQKGGGIIEPALMQDSIQHTLAMYAVNAAAVIAADEATAAMIMLEQSLDANE